MGISDWSSDVCSSDLIFRACRPPSPGLVSRARPTRAAFGWERQANEDRRNWRYRADRYEGCTKARRGGACSNRCVAPDGCRHDRKSTRLTPVIMRISYADFCLQKQHNQRIQIIPETLLV